MEMYSYKISSTFIFIYYIYLAFHDNEELTSAFLM